MGGDGKLLRLLCSKKTLLYPREQGLRWLIGSPLFLPSFNVVSSFRCLHYLPSDPCSPNFTKEADDIRTLLIRGFDIVGALLINNGDMEFNARKAAEASCKMRSYLSVNAEHHDIIGAAADLNSDSIQFFKYEMGNFKNVESFSTISYETDPEKLVWEKGCLTRCELALKFPIYSPGNIASDMEDMFSSLIDLTVADLKDPCAAFLVEGPSVTSNETSASIVLHGFELDFSRSISENVWLTSNHMESDAKDLACSQFFSNNKSLSFSSLRELKPYHFLPLGILHPITAIYELRYGENEVGQSEIRRSLHSRLGLPLDRPLLRIASALMFGTKANNIIRNDYPYLKNVHTQIPMSGVSEGIVSLVDGSYEYYHYLLDGIDDNGWGCAYRSLQTIISWFRLQRYASIEVPSHREIQQALVDIGDKEPSFVGSREWIGAIELGFVLDKLLGVSCKIMNLRSGAELPEKCRELAKHFESQGTPVMIGGGVLAYTLLGVDYNETSGDCAFLILDPHYTGNDDLKKIVNGGWCGWKKPVDSKGRSFFLKDKFYNLLLPQRPNMV
ncbi:probable Ufm1-specific protease isoform X4 [Dendrobium catenatum]|uniref:probable Ufm1-specific protease isoform X4 n=1 Tax=Dendrobium catenatum TaxID=906689 RepID=UPI00109FFD42|nr:probable Ufm1-specific protease isoform X4 [Dendrobium catenatum]